MLFRSADFTFAVQGVQFNGIAIGTIVILVAYHGLKVTTAQRGIHATYPLIPLAHSTSARESYDLTVDSPH